MIANAVTRWSPVFVAGLWLAASVILARVSGRETRAEDEPPNSAQLGGRKLSHEETLAWVAQTKAWRPARKTRPIWARPVEPDEAGKEFQTADGVKEKAQLDSWLCAGVAGEPWFQAREKIDAKYEPDVEESRAFGFDTKPHVYRKFKPKGTSRNWVAQVKGDGIEGFTIRPGYDPERPLYSPAGGYVIKDESPDPYGDNPRDVWLVQQSLFESTYEILPAEEPKR